jgi:hypothetical protein
MNAPSLYLILAALWAIMMFLSGILYGRHRKEAQMTHRWQDRIPACKAAQAQQATGGPVFYIASLSGGDQCVVVIIPSANTDSEDILRSAPAYGSARGM